MTTRNTGFSSFAIRVLVAVLLIGVLGGSYLVYLSRTASQRSSAEETTLQTAKAMVGDLVLYANGTATLTPVAESSFGFSSSGQVSEIYVKIGDKVQAGDVLAKLDDTDAQIALAEAREAMNALTSDAAVATAKQTLAAAKESFDLAKERLEYLISPEVSYWEEKVSEREQTLADARQAAQSDTSEAATKEVADAETSLTYAQNQLKYFQTVYQETYVTKNFTQYETRRGRGGTHTSVIKVWDEKAGKYVDLVYPPTEGEIAMARADYDLTKASIEEAQTYLDVLHGADFPEGATGASLVTYIQTQHTLATAEYNLNATKLIAPISGTVTALDIQMGDLADGSAIVTVSNLEQPYSLDGYLDADDWGQVRAGYEVDVTFDIIPDRVFIGTVTEVYPMLDTSSSSTALVHIAARLNESIPYDLPSGSAASVDVIGGRAEHAVLVPVEALHEIGEGQYTLFAVEAGKLRLRVVDVGLQDLTKAEILSGLSAGDVVTTGVVKTK